MIICKDDCYAYTGATASEAYKAYLDSNDDHNNLQPNELEWFSATEMNLMMRLEAKPKPDPVKKPTKGYNHA